MPTELKSRVLAVIDGKPANYHTVKKVIMLVVQYIGEVSSDDVRFYIKKFDPSSSIVGTAFRSLISDEKIKQTGYKKTDLKSSKGRPIAVYEAA